MTRDIVLLGEDFSLRSPSLSLSHTLSYSPTPPPPTPKMTPQDVALTSFLIVFLLQTGSWYLGTILYLYIQQNWYKVIFAFDVMNVVTVSCHFAMIYAYQYTWTHWQSMSKRFYGLVSGQTIVHRTSFMLRNPSIVHSFDVML